MIRNEKRVRIPVTARHEAKPEVEQDEVVIEERSELLPEDELEMVRQEVVEYKDKYLRAAAEVENTRKRLERRYVVQAEEEKKRLLRAFLAVADSVVSSVVPAGRSTTTWNSFLLSNGSIFNGTRRLIASQPLKQNSSTITASNPHRAARRLRNGPRTAR